MRIHRDNAGSCTSGLAPYKGTSGGEPRSHIHGIAYRLVTLNTSVLAKAMGKTSA